MTPIQDTKLPIFPLQMVLCPGGIAHLNIFEARYLDMIKSCVKNRTGFVIATILPEGQTDTEGNLPFGEIGVQVTVSHLDVVTIGQLQITCFGNHRVKILSYVTQGDNLHIGVVEKIENELEYSVPEDLTKCCKLLSGVLDSLNKHLSVDKFPVIKPYCLHDAGWVANRWVELLQLPLIEKYRLMMVESPILRLELIQDALEPCFNFRRGV